MTGIKPLEDCRNTTTSSIEDAHACRRTVSSCYTVQAPQNFQEVSSIMRSPSAMLRMLSKSQPAVAITCLVALLAAAAAKLVTVLVLARLGTPPQFMRYQDAIITGILAAAFVWAFLEAERARQREQQRQIQVVADLNHNLRNALEVILAAEYLRQTDRAAAILQSVERIDRTLRAILSEDQR